jgi:D-sedoheptulose 7-phosphate isomerase
VVSHISAYFEQVADIARKVDAARVEAMVDCLVSLRDRRGRLFCLGVGGSAANCSHAVNDFRKLCGIDAYAPTDNVSELTARTNDEGWDTVFRAWLEISRLSALDAVFVLSVGGGSSERNVSMNIVRALEFAKDKGAKVLGIVGRDGGATLRMGDQVVLIPTVDDKLVTPHTEAFQAVVWHCLVSHPKLQRNATKW